ncbi:NAD(P)/FAD-dependent oxidoreductase [Paraburkholderia sp. 22B1P]|uniref:NAD(P)/FAD-dependent oxidoreductase n=1 Tax=Paraburkholderia sp. 22B1P TaxID=3080498 RepID=UPI003088ED3F|nr:NAD(P)/FAD-dependent oxidoreductase [Paraburkholderia sp. 22B1P]
MSHRIVVVGGGAGGLELVTRLGRTLGKSGRADVTLIDGQMTHLWKPLLHEVAAGSLDAARDKLNFVVHAKWNHFAFQLGTLCGLDRDNRLIRLAPILDDLGKELMPTRMIPYDTLVLAVGSTTNDFNTPGVAEHCLFLDTPQEAKRFHRRLLQHYLAAQASQGEGESGEERLSIAIVGAGATGVELAAELRAAAGQLAEYGLDSIAPDGMRITLVDAGPRILPALAPEIGESVRVALAKMGVTVLTSTMISGATAEGLTTRAGYRIPASLKVWAAGICAPRVLSGLDGLETNRLNQLRVLTTLQTTRDENIFAIGDCAACPISDHDERLVPPRAQAAHQQAELLARSLVRRVEARPLLKYRYRDQGSVISLSRFTAVAQLMGTLFGRVNLSGRLARLLYSSLYRMHQVSVYGPVRAALLIVANLIGRRASPDLKLH